MDKVYIYKLTTDNGGAPCVRERTLSLAICKPAVRSTAHFGDIILGFAANTLYSNNCLVYAAKVTRHLDAREYFSKVEYEARPDCVYRWNGSRFDWKPGAKYHSKHDMEHDLGKAPVYSRAHVLLSKGAEKFRYFRGDSPIDYKTKYPHLKELVESIGQGCRVNFGDAVRNELRGFLPELWGARSPHEDTPIPSAPCPDTCGGADDDYACGEC